jgi:hypothetical protein
VLETVGIDVPAFDHNPTTLESLGLLVEEQRTNSISNNTMVGAAAGTPGTLPTGWPFQSAGVAGLAVAIVGTGTEAGITYLDWKVSGTATAATGATICTGRGSALTAQTWTTSSYLKLAAGSLSGVTGITLDLIEETAATAFVTGAGYSISLPTTNSLITQRPTASRTLSGGATVAQVRTNLSVAVSSGSAIDFTLRIGLPQLEQGAFATSVIPTSTAAVTRSADVCSITGSAFSSWYRQDEGTVFVAGVSNGANGSGFFTLEDGSAAEYSRLGVGFSLLNFIVSKASGTQADVYSTGTSFVFGSPFRGVAAYALNNVGLSLNGASAQVDTTADMPSAATALRIGFGKYTTYANGTIRRLCYWNQRLADSTLQNITQ